MVDLYPLERAILDAIAERHPKHASALRAQLSSADVCSRENTGAGFFVRFSVPVGAPPIYLAETDDYPLSGPKAQVDGMKYGMGFVLWLADGNADVLEGFDFGSPDSTIGIDFANVGYAIQGVS